MWGGPPALEGSRVLQYILYVILAPAAALAQVFVAMMAHTRRDTPPAGALLGLNLCTLGWLVTNSIELIAVSPSTTLLWAKITYVFVGATTIGWIQFALQYTGRREWLQPSRFAPLAFVPLVTAVLALTNDCHNLIWREYEFLPASGFLHMRVVEYGPWFWVQIAFSYAYVAMGAAIILVHYVRSAGIYRRQSTLVALGALIPIATNIIYVFRIVPGWTKDYTPIGIATASFFFGASIFRERLLDLWPISRDRLVEGMRDAVIVIDPGGRIVDANPATLIVVPGLHQEVVGEPLSAVLPVLSLIHI